MNILWLLVPALAVAAAQPASSSQFPQSVTFSTLIKTNLPIEGLTEDDAGNLYTVGRGNPCLVWRIDPTDPALVVVGRITAPCSPSGVAFDAAGDLFVADGTKVWKLTPSETDPPTVTVPFTSSVAGANGLAFDRDGNLWTGDGTTGQGRVWRIAPDGSVTEVFRIQPMRNGATLGGTLAGDGVGRQARTFQPVAPPNPQDLVANGLAFDEEGALFVADTARGAIWKARFDREGNLQSATGCDPTFTPNTLCLDAIFVAHPLLEGADGFVLDRAGNFWVDANERNAVVVVTKQRRVIEVFRDPADRVTGLRNGGPLETPTSPVLSGHRFCTANSDGDRRDNSPRSAGEVNGTGKISCMDQPVTIPGLPLPIRHRE